MLAKRFEEERKSLKIQVFDLEKKLEEIKQDLASAESTLSAKTSEVVALQNNLKELDELREMKEVKT